MKSAVLSRFGETTAFIPPGGFNWKPAQRNATSTTGAAVPVTTGSPRETAASSLTARTALGAPLAVFRYKDVSAL